jgi:hypothetical protein
MKRNLALLILMLFLVNFTSQRWIDTRLVGQWQISEIIVNGEKANLNLYPHCENKENIVFKDSTLIWESYIYRKNRCFKNVSKCSYRIERETDYSTKERVSVLKTYGGYQSLGDYVIVAVDSNVLKLKKNRENILKFYKRIK